MRAVMVSVKVARRRYRPIGRQRWMIARPPIAADHANSPVAHDSATLCAARKMERRTRGRVFSAATMSTNHTAIVATTTQTQLMPTPT